MLLQDRAALITGGAGRLGEVIAAILRHEGAAVAQVIADAEAAIGRIDVLVNAHGDVPNCPLLDVEVEEWDRTFDVNVKGTMLMCQAMGRRWVRDRIRGAIVNLSSGASLSARPVGAHYCGSKAAVNLLTEVLATELGPHGIRVNAVASGLVMDEVLTAEAPDQHEYVNLMLRVTPLGRTGSPQDIAQAIAFLASERSSWTTRVVVEITGGQHCGRTHMPHTRTMKN